MPGIRWQYQVDPPESGVVNMARDHAMALCGQEGQGTVRFYRWTRPTVSLGRNEPAAARYRTGLLASALDVVRRPTGGRAVLHDREFTYAVVFPRRALGPLRQAYAKIHEGLALGLCELGVPARLAATGRAASPGTGPCFAVPAPGEVMVGERKLLGSAQARIGSAVLQHGSLLLTCDQARLATLWGTATSDVHAPGVRGAITLEEAMGRLPSWSELVDALLAGLSSTLGPMSAGAVGVEVGRTEASLRERYALPDWTWRR